MGAEIITKSDFNKFADGKKAFKPDIIVWSEGDLDVIEIADKHKIATVNLQWLHEYASFMKMRDKLGSPPGDRLSAVR